jgi:hypothetical protein
MKIFAYPHFMWGNTMILLFSMKILGKIEKLDKSDCSNFSKSSHEKIIARSGSPHKNIDMQKFS